MAEKPLLSRLAEIFTGPAPGTKAWDGRAKDLLSRAHGGDGTLSRRERRAAGQELYETYGHNVAEERGGMDDPYGGY